MSEIGKGDMIECADASPSGFPDVPSLIAGAIYVVRETLDEGRRFNGTLGPGVRLVGVFNAAGRGGKERWYDLERFRPLRKPPSSSLIEQLMKPMKEDA